MHVKDGETHSDAWGITWVREGVLQSGPAFAARRGRHRRGAGIVCLPV
ncbi:MAG: hypothetical protein MZV64_49245 [Ignavibacteriales bacterium]|nr:hypothetical protein [Ignavibacteriales bacterium]